MTALVIMPENLFDKIQLSGGVDKLSPDDRGVYLLIINLEKRKRIRVGRLGTFDFPSGRYIYIGSAMGGLAGRIRRHTKKDKKLRWHIDYFLRHAEIEKIGTLNIEKISKIPGAGRLECDLNKAVQKIPQTLIPVPRFGASDCLCAAHLTYLGNTEGAAMLNNNQAGRLTAKSSL